MQKNLQKPKFRLYVTTNKKVDVKAAKAFVVKRYGAEDVTAVRSLSGGTIVLSARVGNLSNIFRYLTKKRGVQTVRFGAGNI